MMSVLPQESPTGYMDECLWPTGAQLSDLVIHKLRRLVRPPSTVQEQTDLERDPKDFDGTSSSAYDQ